VAPQAIAEDSVLYFTERSMLLGDACFAVPVLYFSQFRPNIPGVKRGHVSAGKCSNWCFAWAHDLV
jgi:hypothetical protein